MKPSNQGSLSRARSTRSHWKETAKNPKRREISARKLLASRRRAGCPVPNQGG